MLAPFPPTVAELPVRLRPVVNPAELPLPLVDTGRIPLRSGTHVPNEPCGRQLPDPLIAANDAVRHSDDRSP